MRPGKKMARKLQSRLNGYSATMSSLGSKGNPAAYKRPGSKPGKTGREKLNRG